MALRIDRRDLMPFLAALRKAAGLTQADLAPAFGRSQSGVSKVEQSADPSLSQLRRYAAGLGLDIEVRILDRAVSSGERAEA